MASCRFVFAGLLFLSLTTPLVAAGGQGDPRLITGVLEWPPTVTNEAFVIVRGEPGDDGLVGELQQWCKQRLRRYEYPHFIEFVDDLPKTPTGKIQRYKLRG